MLNLYYKPSCPYSQRVLKANEDIKAPLLLLDVRADDAAMDELIKKGGKAQVPYLEDTERGVAMYESIDIIDHLAKHYGNGQAPETADPGNVCPIE